MKIINLDHTIFPIVEKILRSGGLVVAPSDTVYGLLVDSSNEKAVRKLIEFKNRPPGKAISVFVSDLDMLKKYAIVSPQQTALLQTILPGPFTVILTSAKRVSPQLESERGTLGLRLPLNEFITGLVGRYGKPVTATSANLSGRHAHYRIKPLLDELSESKQDLIDLVVDAGVLPHNKPSTVIDLTSPSVKILRKGEIMFSAVQALISRSESETRSIGKFLLEKFTNDTENKPLIFVIEGDLGVGKTVLVKGMGAVLGVNDIVSPTFVISYEYQTSSVKIKKLYHMDLYNVQDADEFKYLGIDSLLQPHTVVCIEWGEKSGDIIDRLKKSATVVYVNMTYRTEKEREIKVSTISSL